jgi:hypothetical protein
MQASVYVAREFIRLAAAEAPRVALDLIEALFEIASSKQGLRLWDEHKIEIFDSIQAFPGLPDEFVRTRLPQMATLLGEERDRYKKVQADIAERMRAQEAKKSGRHRLRR